MSELRDDLLTGTRVVIAPARAARPVTVGRSRGVTGAETSNVPAFVADCPFCPGNEAETPPEIMRVGLGAPDTPGWRVRVTPNKYPLVGAGLLGGAHEVVMTSPAHNRSFADLDDAEAVEFVTMWRAGIARHLAAGHAHSHAFVNYGKGSGASIEHPHAQIIALDFVPPFVVHMLDRFAKTDLDLVSDAFDEARTARCVILDRELVVSWCPPASLVRYAARFTSPLGGSRFDLVSDDELVEFACALRNHLEVLRANVGDVPYNVVINTAPADEGRPFHWWADVLPRLTVPGGFESATGLAVCTIDPTAAAATFRGEVSE